MINIIVAASKNMVIGKGNDIPWHLPTDLNYFKRMTLNSYGVVMGRKCWDSIPKKFRPLPNRLNFVVTRNESFKEIGAHNVYELDFFIHVYKKAHLYVIDNPKYDLYIIGGSQIYKEAFKYADRIYLTHIDAEIEGDVYLEGFNRDEWELSEASEYQEENGLRFRFETYLKKNNNNLQ